MLRPYHVENNGSLPITEVMQRRDFVSILMGDRLGIPDDVSFLCSHLTRYITTVIVVVVVVIVVDKERFPRNSSESITNLCLFHETRTSCLMTTVSIRNRCKNLHNGIISNLRCNCAQKTSLTLTHSDKFCSHYYNQTAQIIFSRHSLFM